MRRGGEPATQIDDMVMVGVDDHMIEPPELFENRAPNVRRTEMPQIARTENGVDE